MEWLRKLISRKKDPKAVREAGVRALRKRVSQLEAELHSRGREIEELPVLPKGRCRACIHKK